jgi:hypothetical protein
LLYASDETSVCNQTIFTATADFFAVMQQKAVETFKKYDFDGAGMPRSPTKQGTQNAYGKSLFGHAAEAKGTAKSFPVRVDRRRENEYTN